MKTLIKKISTVLLAVLIMIPVLCLPISAASVGNNIDDILFDWQYYYNKYPDLQRAFGTNQAALRNHYNNYGKAEGRSPSALFDPKVYVGLYPDLKNAMGYNYTALYNHFKNNGIKEGRQGSAYFSVEVYKSNYADLRNAFGTSGNDNWKYLQHWRNHGQSEGRNATTKIANSGSSGGSASTTTYYVKTSGASLNVRSGASTSYSTIGQLANGASVQVYSISNGWAKIKYNNTTGYVSSSYLTSTNTAANSGSTLSSGSWQMPMQNAYCTWSTKTNMSWGGYNYSSSRGSRSYHLGVDIYGTSGAVYAAADGKIVASSTSNSGANGRYIIIQHTINGKTVYSFYAHLSSLQVTSGNVSKGQRIATAGGSGYGRDNYYGTHLHFAVVDTLWSNGSYYGYATSFAGDKVTYSGVTYYNPVYVVNNNKLP